MANGYKLCAFLPLHSATFTQHVHLPSVAEAHFAKATHALTVLHLPLVCSPQKRFRTEGTEHTE